MSFIPVRKEYYMAPDSTRKFLQLMKNHIASYCMRDELFFDVDGLKYNGSMYNFGSEILMETNKLKLSKPPLTNIKFNTDLTFYFDIGFSNVVDAYEQQNMIACSVKRDVFIKSHTYKLVFENVQSRYIIRSPYSSTRDALKETWYITTTPPILFDDDGHVETVYTLDVNDGDGDVVYYFQNNVHTQRHIESLVNGTLTLNVDDTMDELPMIWITCSSLNYLPMIDVENNIDQNGNPLLTIGGDGHGVMFAYPYLYENNFPSYPSGDYPDYHWFMKVESVDGVYFNPNNRQSNSIVPIKSISYCYSESGTSEPAKTVTIMIPPSGIKMYIHDTNEIPWTIHLRRPGDWDFIPGQLNQPCAIMSLRIYAWNKNDNVALIPAYKVDFKNQYLFNYESDMIGSVSGLHVDSSAETADNSVVEVNGVSHMMGDFDGLPEYMHYQLNRKIHRSHVDIYSIRDHNNRYTQLPMKRQTAGLLIDSSVPYNDLKFVTDEESNIIYDNLDGMRYYTSGEIFSRKNVISDIAFIDGNHFADRNTKGNYNKLRFVYHGNNNFSLGIDELDPDIEYARCYAISNDSIKYVNNDSSSKHKPERTLARICDIPTSMSQIANITNYAPSILIDWNFSELMYNRTECNFTDEDIDRITNNKDRTLLRNGNGMVFPNSSSTDFDYTLFEKFKLVAHLNETIYIDRETCVITPYGESSGYEVNDVVKFNIGGQYFTLTIDEVDLYGKPISVSYEGTSLGQVNINNVGSIESVYSTMNVSGSGIGLHIKIEFYEFYWESVTPSPLDTLVDNIPFLMYDNDKNVWLWYVDSNDTHSIIRSLQLSGFNSTNNPYDRNINPDVPELSKRRLIDTMLFNTLCTKRDVYYKWLNDYTEDSGVYLMLKETNIPSSELGLQDLSNELNNESYGLERTLYILYNDNSEEEFAKLKEYSLYNYKQSNLYLGKEHVYYLPRFHNVHLYNYYNINRLLYTTYSGMSNSQPILSYFNPLQNLIYKYERLSNDYVKISDVHTKTFYDVIPEELVKDGNFYYFNNNIYTSDSETFVIDRYINDVNVLNTLPREELLQRIESLVGNKCEPFYYEQTSNPYTKDMLINYLMTVENVYEWNYSNNQQDIRMLRQQYEHVLEIIEENDKTYIVPLGEQPVGDIMTLSDEVHDLDLSIEEDKEISTSILFVFTIPDKFNIPAFYNLRMVDDDGNDVSEYSIIIYRKKKYLYDKDHSNWIPV